MRQNFAQTRETRNDKIFFLIETLLVILLILSLPSLVINKNKSKAVQLAKTNLLFLWGLVETQARAKEYNVTVVTHKT